jgi:hypothetical protein
MVHGRTFLVGKACGNKEASGFFEGVPSAAMPIFFRTSSTIGRRTTPHDPRSLSACDEFRQPIADYRDGACKMLDMMMLVGPGGQERTEQEYGELLSKEGLRLTRVVPTESPVSVVEAGLA